MKRLLFSLKLMVLVCAFTWISGCQYDPFADSYTQKKPLASDIPGTYVLSDQTLNDMPIDKLTARNGSKSSPHQLILYSNGTFSMINMPVWAGDWANKSIDEWSISKFQSGSGRWKIEVTRMGDDADYWGLTFTSPNISVGNATFSGEKSPYDIIFGYGDPDEGNAMIYEKQSSSSE